jgi:hypothetical protein
MNSPVALADCAIMSSETRCTTDLVLMSRTSIVVAPPLA